MNRDGLMVLVVLAMGCVWLLLAAVKNPRRSEELSRVITCIT